MALDPAEFLAQAPLLMEAGGEAGYRSAINRAYYACHLMARDRLFGLDAAQWEGAGRRPSHRAVVRALRGRPSTRGVARSLNRLRKTREVADYVRDDSHVETREAFALNGVSDWEGAAQISLQRAREVFAALQSLPTDA